MFCFLSGAHPTAPAAEAPPKIFRNFLRETGFPMYFDDPSSVEEPIRTSALITSALMMADRAIDAAATCPVTGKAPSHFHRGNPFDHWHFGNLTMALVTRDTAGHMALVIEFHVVGHHMHLDPRNRLP